jgi:hypothetical protein
MATDQDHFQTRTNNANCSEKYYLFKSEKEWNLNHNPLFLDFLTGEKDL